MGNIYFNSTCHRYSFIQIFGCVDSKSQKWWFPFKRVMHTINQWVIKSTRWKGEIRFKLRCLELTLNKRFDKAVVLKNDVSRVHHKGSLIQWDYIFVFTWCQHLRQIFIIQLSKITMTYWSESNISYIDSPTDTGLAIYEGTKTRRVTWLTRLIWMVSWLRPA